MKLTTSGSTSTPVNAASQENLSGLVGVLIEAFGSCQFAITTQKRGASGIPAEYLFRIPPPRQPAPRWRAGRWGYVRNYDRITTVLRSGAREYSGQFHRAPRRRFFLPGSRRRKMMVTYVHLHGVRSRRQLAVSGTREQLVNATVSYYCTGIDRRPLALGIQRYGDRYKPGVVCLSRQVSVLSFHQTKNITPLGIKCWNIQVAGRC